MQIPLRCIYIERESRVFVSFAFVFGLSAFNYATLSDRGGFGLIVGSFNRFLARMLNLIDGTRLSRDVTKISCEECRVIDNGFYSARFKSGIVDVVQRQGIILPSHGCREIVIITVPRHCYSCHCRSQRENLHARGAPT